MAASDMRKELREFVEAVKDSPPNQGGDLLRRVLAFAVAQGYTYSWANDVITIRSQDDEVIVVRTGSDVNYPQLSLSLFSALTALEDTASQRARAPMSLDDLARFVNEGVLKREIDVAVEWDPELSV